jgi:hypothetical protein
VLARLYFYGAGALENELLFGADEDIALGLFGNRERQTHVLVVNRRTWQKRTVTLTVKGQAVVDVATGEILPMVNDQVQVALAAGGFRLLAVARDN